MPIFHAYIPNAISNAMVINPPLTIIYRIPSRPPPTSLAEMQKVIKIAEIKFWLKKLAPKNGPKMTQNSPKMTQNGPKMTQNYQKLPKNDQK